MPVTGVTFTIGGKLDSSLKGALSSAEAQAVQSGKKISRAQSDAYAAYWKRQASIPPDVKRRMAADLNVETAARQMLDAMGGGWQGDKASIRIERDAMARALRARRALRDGIVSSVTGAAGVAGATAGASFSQRFLANLRGAGSGGIAQIFSVISNTASSLGSGISPVRILAQQGPNLIQGLASIFKDGIRLAFAGLRIASIPLAGAAAAYGIAASASAARKAQQEEADSQKALTETYAEIGRKLRGMIMQLEDSEQISEEYAKKLRLATWRNDPVSQRFVQNRIRGFFTKEFDESVSELDVSAGRFAEERARQRYNSANTAGKLSILRDLLATELGTVAANRGKNAELESIKGSPLWSGDMQVNWNKRESAALKAETRALEIAGAIRELEQSAAGGAPQPLTERERIGAYAGGMNVSLVDLGKKQLAAINKLVEQQRQTQEVIRNTY